MRAAQFRHFGDDAHIEAVADPQIDIDDVLVRVACCQIGGDILKIMAGDGPVRDRERFAFPHTPGYRGAGTVEAVGPGVDRVAVGDRVVINGFLNCGECRYCRQGNDNLCVSSRMIGIDSGSPGAMAELLRAPARSAYRIPDSVSFERSTLLPNIALIVHAYRRVDPEQPFTTAIFGCGLVGTGAIAVARAIGATQILAVDISPAALALADACGATETVDAGKADPVAVVRELTRGEGVDVAVEIVGLGTTITHAALSTRALGVTLLIGALGGRRDQLGGVESQTVVSFHDYYHDVIQREIELRACFGKSQSDFAEAVKLAESGALDLSPFPLRVFPFEEISKAIDSARDPRNAAVHVVTFD